MGITTSWSINNLHVFKASGWVEEIHWNCACVEWEDIEVVGNDTTQAGITTGFVGIGSTKTTQRYIKGRRVASGRLELGGSGASPDIAYNDLTEDTVVGWVKTGLGTTQVARIQNDLNPNPVVTSIESIKEIRQGDALPWT
tara:strand:- start:45 stop:467 length:423 start_codon:yes stop_codon:yes gene_type:complete